MLNQATHDKELFQQEQNELLFNLLDNRFFSQWRQLYTIDTQQENFSANCCNDELLINVPDHYAIPLYLDKFDYQNSLRNCSDLELYITPSCNQNCTYCYLVQFQEKLYPQAINNFETILQNLNIIIDWCIQQHYAINTVDIFTGEILQSQFGLNLLKTICDGLRRGWKVHQFIFASNMSFCLNDEQTQKIQQYLDLVHTLGSHIQISASIDGLIIENKSRPLNSQLQKDETFFDNVFGFCKRNGFEYHPMVSAYNVKWWKENYDWWKQQLKKLDAGRFSERVMALEVRNNDWTDEAINDYNDLMEYMLKDNLTLYGAENIAYIVLCDPRGSECMQYFRNYIPWILTEAIDFTPCTLAYNLAVRLGDLAIVPCHRTSYAHLLYGKFIVKDNQIKGIEAINPGMAIKCLIPNFKKAINGCDTCIYSNYCLRGCLGAQIENQNDPWFPIAGVCKFQKSKIRNLIKLYKEYGIFDIIKKITPYEPSYPIAQRLVQLDKLIQKEETENVG